MPSWLNRISPQINDCWRGEWQKRYVEPARYLYDHELVLVMRGLCRVTIGERTLDLRAGQFVIVPPATCHTSWAVEPPVYRACIHFDWTEKGAGRSHPVCRYHPQRPERHKVVRRPPFIPAALMHGSFEPGGAVSALVETLFPRWQAAESRQRALCRGPFLELLTRLLWPQGREKAKGSRRTQLAYAAKELLEVHGERAPSVRSLLAKLGFSYPHLSRLFRRTFGVTPVEYLIARRLEHARELLSNPLLTITEISHAVGFRDPGYFARCFTRQNRMSPRAFRAAGGN